MYNIDWMWLSNTRDKDILTNFILNISALNSKHLTY